jgi:DNA-binding response OmpR family regulator
MNNHNLIIYQFTSLYQILKELEQELNFKITEILNEKSLNNETKDLKNYLIVTQKKIINANNQYIFDHPPIKILKLVEKFNIKFVKQQFNDQSEISINNYKINLNSREMSLRNINLKLTEKEVNTILYMSKKMKPVSIEELETSVWKYQSDIETHTVETHIYRLRKKIFKVFEDNNFITSKKNGYQIK